MRYSKDCRFWPDPQINTDIQFIGASCQMCPNEVPDSSGYNYMAIFPRSVIRGSASFKIKNSEARGDHRQYWLDMLARHGSFKDPNDDNWE